MPPAGCPRFTVALPAWPRMVEPIAGVPADISSTGEPSDRGTDLRSRDHQEAAEPVTGQTYTQMLASGAEYAEFDIRRTADGVLVAYHDARAGRAGPLVSGLEYTALCDRVGYAVPRVDEVMALLAGRLTGHLDLKEAGYEEEVTGLAASILGPGNYVITTLEDVSVAAIKRASPQTRTALSLGRSLKGVPRHRWAAVRAQRAVPAAPGPCLRR